MSHTKINYIHVMNTVRVIIYESLVRNFQHNVFVTCGMHD